MKIKSSRQVSLAKRRRRAKHPSRIYIQLQNTIISTSKRPVDLCRRKRIHQRINTSIHARSYHKQRHAHDEDIENGSCNLLAAGAPLAVLVEVEPEEDGDTPGKPREKQSGGDIEEGAEDRDRIGEDPDGDPEEGYGEDPDEPISLLADVCDGNGIAAAVGGVVVGGDIDNGACFVLLGLASADLADKVNVEVACCCHT